MTHTKTTAEPSRRFAWLARLNALAEALDYDPLAFHDRRIARLEADVASLKNALTVQDRGAGGAP